MTSVPITRTAPHSATAHLRLRLKPRGSVAGFVDGGWWPRSRDLPAELPALLAVLGVRLGPVERVSYNLDEWGPTARRITLDGRPVRLAGYHSQHPATIDVVSARQRVTLLVVPPAADPQAAQVTLMAAGRRANADPVEELLASTVDDADEAAQQRWDLDGGSVRVHSSRRRRVRARRA